MYLNKGAHVRSRAKWTEEGEKNPAYFCHLEKCRQEYNSVRSLIINGEECTDPNRFQMKSFTFTATSTNPHTQNKTSHPSLTKSII